MVRATKTYKYKYSGKGFTVEYDTAYELGYAVGEHGLRMGNPYEPDTTAHDDFIEGREDAKASEVK